MHHCNICNYYTNESRKIRNHYNSQKHIKNTNAINNINTNNDLICSICKKEYKYLTSLKKHQMNCNNNETTILVNDKINEVKKDY
jgi:hypothetical protein